MLALRVGLRSKRATSCDKLGECMCLDSLEGFDGLTVGVGLEELAARILRCGKGRV